MQCGVVFFPPPYEKANIPARGDIPVCRRFMEKTDVPYSPLYT